MSLTVRELRDLLNDADPDALVILSKDGEGNRFSPADHAEHELWRWDASEDDIVDILYGADHPAAFVIWPVR